MPEGSDVGKRGETVLHPEESRRSLHEENPLRSLTRASKLVWALRRCALLPNDDWARFVGWFENKHTVDLGV